MKEKRLLQRLGKAVVSASSHKGMACAHPGDTRAQGFAGRQELDTHVHVCTNLCNHPGQCTAVKSGLMMINRSLTGKVSTRPLTPNTMHVVELPFWKIKYSLNQSPWTNGCSGMYSVAEPKEYKNNDLLQKHPRVLASWCAQSFTLTDTHGKILKDKELHRLQTGCNKD